MLFLRECIICYDIAFAYSEPRPLLVRGSATNRVIYSITRVHIKRNPPTNTQYHPCSGLLYHVMSKLGMRGFMLQMLDARMKIEKFSERKISGWYENMRLKSQLIRSTFYFLHKYISCKSSLFAKIFVCYDCMKSWINWRNLSRWIMRGLRSDRKEKL